MDLVQLLLLFALSLSSVFYFLIKLLSGPKNKKRMAPMAAGAWPVIGHLRAIDNGQPSHVTFGSLADVYGPVFMTKLGSVNTLIISSKEVAKEIFTVHDNVLNRPIPTASKILGYNDSFFMFNAQHSYWREMRKMSTSEILSAALVDMKRSRAREVDVAFRDLYKKWEQKSGGGRGGGILVDMKQEFLDLLQNMTLMMMVGKRYCGTNPNCEAGEAKRCSKLIKECLDYFGAYLFSDLIPPLGWLDWRIKRSMKRTASELDKVVESWVEEHKIKREDSSCGVEKTLLHRIIETLEQHKNSSVDDPHTTTKAICLNLVLSGPEAAATVLVWAVSVLVNNPDVLRKVQEEINVKIGKDRVLEESDLKDLVYLQAVVKETFRLYPPVPLLAYRDVMEDFDICDGNFHVHAGTQLYINAWKIQRDPSLWSNPVHFEPERFLTSNRDVNVGGQSYQLFPFGLGRKACPAIPLATRMVQYVLARFLHNFDVERPSSQHVDMTGTNGFSNLKSTPLEVLITPRLYKSLYDQMVHS